MLNKRIVAPKPKVISQNICREMCTRTNKNNKKDYINNISNEEENFMENLTKEFHDLEAKEEILEILKNDICKSISNYSLEKHKIHLDQINCLLENPCEDELSLTYHKYQNTG